MDTVTKVFCAQLWACYFPRAVAWKCTSSPREITWLVCKKNTLVQTLAQIACLILINPFCTLELTFVMRNFEEFCKITHAITGFWKHSSQQTASAEVKTEPQWSSYATLEGLKFLCVQLLGNYSTTLAYKLHGKNSISYGCNCNLHFFEVKIWRASCNSCWRHGMGHKSREKSR